MIDWIFWFSLIMLVYIYIGYPILIFIISLFTRRNCKNETYEPAITILIAAYNEEVSIRATLENKLKLNYPVDKLEIIVISDGSTDMTDGIVREFEESNVKLIRQEPRKGKTSALNMAVPMSKGDILVFSDANSIYEPDALQMLVRNFSNPEIGYVTGKMVYTNPDGTIVGDGCSTYMKYENILRKYESLTGSVVGVDGGIDAVQKRLYQPMRVDQQPDFVLPLKVIEQGCRVIYEPNAILREQTLKTTQDEYRMRVRVSLRALWTLNDLKHIFNPFKYGIFSLQLISHKLLRYAAFIFLITLYMSNIFLINSSVFFQYIFLGQNIFYILSFVGRLSENKGRSSKLFYIPYYFLLINIAAGYAFIKFLKGEKQVIWDPRKG